PLPQVGEPGQPASAMRIPEVDEDIFHFPGCRSIDADVRVAPLGCVVCSNVVATYEGCASVHYQNLTVVTGVAAQVQWMPRPGQERILQHKEVGGGRKALEA